MKKIILALALIAAPAAHADGFRCQTVEGDLNVTVYNQVQPEAGTRNAAVMILSNPAVGAGKKTIAKFTDAKGTLANSGASFAADVDLRMVESRTKGEYLVGTRLGNVDQILVDVDYAFGTHVQNGEELEGHLTVIKRDGARIERDLSCERYLKN